MMNSWEAIAVFINGLYLGWFVCELLFWVCQWLQHRRQRRERKL